MIENVLNQRGTQVRTRIAIKIFIAAGIIALAVLLPQIVHAAFGAEGGARWLPMYLPVLLGACLLGWRWGLGIGIFSPLLSFIITSAAGSAMPIAARLPYMMLELGAFALVSGAFSGKIFANAWMAFPAVLLAQVCGRAVFFVFAVIFQNILPLAPMQVWSQILSGLPGLLLQAVLVPVLVIVLRAVLLREKQ